MSIEEYTEFLIKSICHDPDMVKVTSHKDDETNQTIIEVMIKDDDMSVVIGKSGKNIKSIRVLVEAYAYLNKVGRVKLNVDSF